MLERGERLIPSCHRDEWLRVSSKANSAALSSRRLPRSSSLPLLATPLAPHLQQVAQVLVVDDKLVHHTPEEVE
jgi:hypothetical protein